MNSETNLKEAAIAFLQMTARGQVEEAFARYVDPDFRHHNPHFPGDAASIKDGMLENARRFPDMVFEVQRAIADGDLVAVHSRAQLQPGTPELAIVHIVRFENGGIAELWDIGQAAPEPMANQYGMF